MPLQINGQISISDIMGEIPTIIQNVSLTSLSTDSINIASPIKPDGSAPHAMSEFYGYDHYASSGPNLTQIEMSSQTYPSYYDAMIICDSNSLTNYWFDGQSFVPQENDRIYTNSSGTSTLNSRHVYGPWGSVITTNGQGFVDSIMPCDGGPGDGDLITRR